MGDVTADAQGASRWGSSSGLPVSVLKRRSEDETLRRLIRDHEAAIRRLAHSILNDRRDEEEALLDTFAKAHAARRLYRGEASERTWIHRICFNLCVDKLRRRPPDCPPLDPGVATPVGADDPELSLALWQEIDDLPAHLQAPFKLKHAGYSVTEISELAGMKRTTVSGHYHAACQRLRERLAELLDEPPREGS